MKAVGRSIEKLLTYTSPFLHTSERTFKENERDPPAWENNGAQDSHLQQHLFLSLMIPYASTIIVLQDRHSQKLHVRVFPALRRRGGFTEDLTCSTYSSSIVAVRLHMYQGLDLDYQSISSRDVEFKHSPLRVIRRTRAFDGLERAVRRVDVPSQVAFRRSRHGSSSRRK